MDIQSTRDILNLVLAGSILLVALCLSYFILSTTQIIRDIRDISKLIKEKLVLIDSLLIAIKEKLEHSATYFGILTNIVEKFLEHQKAKKQHPSDQNDHLKS